MKRHFTTGLCCMAILAAAGLRASPGEVDLAITVADHGEVKRTGDPVSGGVPFPKGYLKAADVKRLVLTGGSASLA